ncbi:MAG: FAD-dependent monooxygenase, partial [Stackebrandtia sp.]
AELRHGAAVTDIDLDPAVVHHGSRTEQVDGLLVAADGIDSVVRARFDPDRAPVYAGDVVVYGMTNGPLDTPPPSSPAVLHFFGEIAEDGSSASTVGHIWRPDDPVALWFVRIAREPLSGGDDLGVRPVGEWADTVAAATPSSRAMVSTLLSCTDVVHVSNARNVPVERARDPQDSVVLIGDADHAVTPAAGVGARDALEDARAVFDAIIGDTSPAAAMLRRREQLGSEREIAQRRMPRRRTA